MTDLKARLNFFSHTAATKPDRWPKTSTLVQQSASSRPRRRHVDAYEVPQDVELVVLTLLHNQASLAGNPSM